MPPKKSEYQAIQDNLVDWMAKVQENLAKQIGPVGEPVSPKDQMAAFKDMKPEDWVRMTEEKGVGDTEAFMKEMLRRQKMSEKLRRPV